MDSRLRGNDKYGRIESYAADNFMMQIDNIFV